MIPKVSIILPVYNAGKYLRPCMDTLVNQTLREIEIICVLDCPTDGSDKIIEEYATKDDRIVVIRNEQNLNIGESRNVGLRAARGEFIGFSDHDDTRELDMYEKLYAATRNEKKKFVISGDLSISYIEDELSSFFRITPTNKEKYPIYQYLFYTLLIRGGRTYRAHITSNLYNREHIIKNNLFFVDTKQYFAEDLLFNLLVLSTINDDSEIALVSKYYYYHISHGGNTILSTWYGDKQHVIAYSLYISDLINQITWIDPSLLNVVLPVIQLSNLYTSFRKEIRCNGLFQTFSSFRNTIQGNNALNKMINNIPMLTKNLTLPKRLFLFWLKLLCRH